jgi:hypothetical protein
LGRIDDQRSAAESARFALDGLSSISMSYFRGWIWIALVFAACAGPGPTAPDAAIVLCEEPRRQACTRDYRPVCAKSSSQADRTAGNACGACADPDVRGYVEGECATDGSPARR